MSWIILSSSSFCLCSAKTCSLFKRLFSRMCCSIRDSLVTFFEFGASYCFNWYPVNNCPFSRSSCSINDYFWFAFAFSPFCPFNYASAYFLVLKALYSFFACSFKNLVWAFAYFSIFSFMRLLIASYFFRMSHFFLRYYFMFKHVLNSTTKIAITKLISVT